MYLSAVEVHLLKVISEVGKCSRIIEVHPLLEMPTLENRENNPILGKIGQRMFSGGMR